MLKSKNLINNNEYKDFMKLCLLLRENPFILDEKNELDLTRLGYYFNTSFDSLQALQPIVMEKELSDILQNLQISDFSMKYIKICLFYVKRFYSQTSYDITRKLLIKYANDNFAQKYFKTEERDVSIAYSIIKLITLELFMRILHNKRFAKEIVDYKVFDNKEIELIHKTINEYLVKTPREVLQTRFNIINSKKFGFKEKMYA